MNTLDTEWKIRIREYLNESREYVGETDDLGSVCLDGYFNLEEIAQIIISSQRAHWLRSEIERLESAEMVKSKIGFEKPCTKMQQIKQRVFAQGYNKAKDEFITRYKEELLELDKTNGF